jgi:hypothetical protein
MGPVGVIAIGQNVPSVTHKGELEQSSAAAMLHYVTMGLGRDAIVTDIKMEEFPLEGDYKVSAPTDFFTDEGIAFALASIFEWKDPRNNHPIEYNSGEGLHVRTPVDILNLAGAFKPFDPVNDLELCMVILQRFKVELRYEDRTGNAYFRGRHGEGNKFVTDEQIRREICRSAIDMRIAHISNHGWDGNVHLSMVVTTPTVPKTIAEMASGQQEQVSILKDPPKPSDVFSAAGNESQILTSRSEDREG